MTAREETRDGLAEALERAAEALRLTAARLARVETAIAEVVLRPSQAAASHFADLQELDRSAQEVAGLAEFLDQLARRTPRETLVDVAGAARPILVQDLAAFLGRHPAAPPRLARDEDDDGVFFAQG